VAEEVLMPTEAAVHQTGQKIAVVVEALIVVVVADMQAGVDASAAAVPLRLEVEVAH